MVGGGGFPTSLAKTASDIPQSNRADCRFQAKKRLAFEYANHGRIVGVNADPLPDGMLTFVPDGSCFCPLRMHVGQSNAPTKISLHRLATMRNGVCFHPAGAF